MKCTVSAEYGTIVRQEHTVLPAMAISAMAGRGSSATFVQIPTTTSWVRQTMSLILCVSDCERIVSASTSCLADNSAALAVSLIVVRAGLFRLLNAAIIVLLTRLNAIANTSCPSYTNGSRSKILLFPSKERATRAFRFEVARARILEHEHHSDLFGRVVSRRGRIVIGASPYCA